MQELQKKREELEKRLKRKEDIHYKRPYWHSEGAYRDSVKEIREVYDKLFKVSLDLGDPIPVWF
jgi:hypothetical protein